MFRHLITAGVLIFGVSSVAAQDLCRDVLSDELLNMSTSIRTETSAEADRLYYCSATLDEAKSYYEKQLASSSGSSGGGSISYGPFSAGGAGGSSAASSESLTQSQYNLWKDSSCRSEERDRSFSSFEYLAQQSVATEAVKAWRDCMIAREGFTCWVEPLPPAAVLSIRWNDLAASQAKIEQTFVVGGKSVWAGASEGEILPNEYRLNKGTTKVPVIPEAGSAVTMVVNMSHDGVNESCETFIPAPKRPTIATGGASQYTCPSYQNCFEIALDEIPLDPLDPSPVIVSISPALEPLEGEDLTDEEKRIMNVIVQRSNE